MRRNSLASIALLLAGCDAVAVGNRTQRAGEVKVTDLSGLNENSSEPLESVGAPMAWRVAQGAAFYGGAGQPPVFALSCDRRAESIVFERAGGGPSLTLSAGGLGASLGTREVSGGRVQARTGMTDAVLDAMARSQAQISVGGGAETISVPGGVAIRRVLDACRTPPAPEPIENSTEPANVIVAPPTLLPAPTPEGFRR